jgi:hypothetical protein
MSIPDETLMAFVDGELDAASRALVESALLQDPELAARVARHVALRQRLSSAYAMDLTEPVPQRLLDAANRPRMQTNNVVNLQAARDARSREVADGGTAPATSWRPAAAIAASLIIGFGLGYINRNHGQGDPTLARGADGALNARGALAQALSTQLAATQSVNAEIHIGLSFLAKNGDYCRTFAMSGSVRPSGLACRHQEQWRIESLGQSSDASAGNFRTAGTDLSPQILRAVEERIDGEALDAGAEAQALQKNWHK